MRGKTTIPKRTKSSTRRWICTIAIAPLFAVGSARADDWGCEVLLCLSDPRGPMTEAACVPPIERLVTSLLSGNAFPDCAMESGPDGPAIGATWEAADVTHCPSQLLIGGQDGPIGCTAFAVVEIVLGGIPYTEIWITPAIPALQGDPSFTLTRTVPSSPS